MATNEEIMDTLGIIQSRIVNIETALEDVKTSKQEALEMNEYDRNVILRNISEFEQTLANNIRDVIIKQQSEMKIYNEEFKAEQSLQSENNKHNAEAFFSLAEKTANAICDIKPTIKDVLDRGFNNLHIKERIELIMDSTIKESLVKQTKANEQAVIKLGNTAVQMRETFKKTIYPPFFYVGMVLIGLFSFGGFKCHEFYQNIMCENVFEQFYFDRFEKEIKEPLKQAELKADDYLREQKKNVEAYRKQKEEEADLYLQNKIKEADEEYEKRLQAYVTNAKKEVDKSLRNKKEDN